MNDPVGNPVVDVGGNVTGTVAAGAGTTVVKGGPGRLVSVLVTTAGTGTGSVAFYDNASAGSGTEIGIVPATIAVGTFYTFNMPAANGITVVNVASGPALTVSFL
jgi:hypothetical protein